MSATSTTKYSTTEVSSQSCSAYLNWKERPLALQEAVSKSFEQLAQCTLSNWGLYNGLESYGICRIDEHKLMKEIIKNAPVDQKDFYALDIGAGDFRWGDRLVTYLEQQTDLPPSIRIHVIGIRGEQDHSNQFTDKGRFTIRKLGAFKIEEIEGEFEKLGLDLHNKIDLAISHFCFRHLLAPVCTFAQVYNLLRPSTGYLLTDGFANDRLVIELFLDIGAPFLTKKYTVARSFNHYCLQKLNEMDCHLPMQYTDYIGDATTKGSTMYTEASYRRTSAPKEIRKFVRGEGESLRGNKNMYEFLKKARLINSDLVWRPIQTKDEPLMTPPLHAAILAKDNATIQELLDTSDINESDASGNTPLHLCIQTQNIELFKQLLERKADIGLCNECDQSLLHTAATHDIEGSFLNILISLSAPIEQQADLLFTPLDMAIEAKNTKAVEILVGAGARMFYEDNENALATNPEFEILRNSGVISALLNKKQFQL